jgi:DNA-binding response OmpR family regulator
MAGSVIESGNLMINDLTRTVTVRGAEVKLTLTQYNLLHYLARYPGFVFSEHKLLAHVWGHNYPIETRTVSTTIGRLKRKLGEEGARIVNIRSFGYKLKEPAPCTC